MTESGDGVAVCGGQELGLTGTIPDGGGVRWTVDDGGESANVRRFLGLVLVGRSSLELALGTESCRVMLEFIRRCRTVITSGLKVKGMDLLPLAKMTISSGQLDKNLPGSISLVTNGAAVTLSNTKPSRPLRVLLVLGDIAMVLPAD